MMVVRRFLYDSAGIVQLRNKLNQACFRPCDLESLDVSLLQSTSVVVVVVVVVVVAVVDDVERGALTKGHNLLLWLVCCQMLLFCCCCNLCVVAVVVTMFLSFSYFNIFPLMEVFATFCGLGLHNVLMYEEMVMASARNKVAFDVLAYHASSSVEEANRLMVCVF